MITIYWESNIYYNKTILTLFYFGTQTRSNTSNVHISVVRLCVCVFNY